jgi:hypothetical protein
MYKFARSLLSVPFGRDSLVEAQRHLHMLMDAGHDARHTAGNHAPSSGSERCLPEKLTIRPSFERASAYRCDHA